jgi:predicted PurR-regulated permease PerM
MDQPTPTTQQFSPALQFLIGLAAFTICIAGLRAASDIIIPILTGVFVAVVTMPVVVGLRRFGIPSVVATLFVLAFIAVVGFFFSSLVVTALQDLAAEIPVYLEELRIDIIEFTGWLDRKGFEDPEWAYRKYNEVVQTDTATNLAGWVLNFAGGLLTQGLLALFTVIFILLEAATFPFKLQAIGRGSTRLVEKFERTLAEVRGYMALKTLISAVTGALVTGMLYYLEVEYAILWGLLAFFMNFVPNIGSFLAAIPAVAVAFLKLGMWEAIYAASAYAVINVTIGNFIEPRVMGYRMGLSPLVVLLSLILWGWIFGPIGMLLSVPLTMIVKISLEGSEESRWLAILLSNDAPPKEKSRWRRKKKEDAKKTDPDETPPSDPAPES